MVVEGPNDTTYKGVEAKYYLVYSEEAETKGYVYYHAETQELIGTSGQANLRVLDKNKKQVSPATL